MSAAHTPGPWEVDGTKLGVRGKAVSKGALYGSGGFSIAEILPAMTDAEAFANARLIAAAPDLLALVLNILPLAIKTDPEGQWVADARAAIAKAEGRA